MADDADLLHECSQERLAGGRVAFGNHGGQMGLQGVEVVVSEGFESVVGGGEFGALCFEFGEPLGATAPVTH